MGHIPHALREEFPEFADRIPSLEESDGHFRSLAAQYNEVNQQIHKLEAGGEPARELEEDGLRQKRLFLKDEIYSILKRH